MLKHQPVSRATVPGTDFATFTEKLIKNNEREVETSEYIMMNY